MEIIDGFAAVLPLNRLIITKLDETRSYGMILNACRHLGQPLAYVTTGQSVPEDIEVADPNKIADLILGDRHVRSGRDPQTTQRPDKRTTSIVPGVGHCHY